MPRSVSLPVDEQQRMQYTQMLSGRNVQQSGLPVPGNLPVDRGVRMLPGTSAMGMMCGMNRGMPSMPRAGFQGINSPEMLNMVPTSAMLSGNGVTNPVTAHQGNSMLRPHDTMHMLRVSIQFYFCILLLTIELINIKISVSITWLYYLFIF